MGDALLPSEVHGNEWLARFIFSKSHIRSSDNTVKQDAFIPPPDLQLSVTRHLDLSEEELWQSGEGIADYLQVSLYGRADLQAIDARNQTLDVRPDSPPKNHAVIFGWPTDKPTQKIIAQQLARSAHYVPNPG